MTQPDQLKLQKLKTTLRAVIALADKATAGPWISRSNHKPYKVVWMDRPNNYSTLEIAPRDADFIAASRQLLPATAKALLEDIEFFEEQTRELAILFPGRESKAGDRLTSILSTFPDEDLI